MTLNIEPNIANPDAFYENLIGLHAGLDDGQSFTLNTRLVQALSAQVDDAEALQEAARIAATGQTTSGTPEQDARLILILANHIGDATRLTQAFQQAQTAGL